MASNGISPNSIVLAILLACCILMGLPAHSHAARILGYFPSSSKSHLLIHCSIADTLAKAGHDVTVFGGAPNVYKNAKYKYIYLDGTGFDPKFARDMVNDPQPIYKRFSFMTNMIVESSNKSLTHPKMRKFLQENGEGSIDLLILGYFMNEMHLGLGGHFRCPIIISFMIQTIHPLNKFIGNPDEFAYVPTVFSGLKQPMGFSQRVKNYFSGLIDRFFIDKLISGKNAKLYEHHFPPSSYPSFQEVAENISLIFSNHHSHSQGPIRPNVPALIEIGGIQMKEKPSPLPTDIAEILDNSKEGVIYFSFGSNVDGSVLIESTAKKMFNVLSKLPYKVLWKWGESEFPGISKNIIYRSWLPQDDILAHPNVKLFITHAGQGSVVESQSYGVPMVAIPLFGDQPANAAMVESSGFGVQLDYITLTEESFRNGILEVLNNPKYSKAVKEFSKLYHDRPMTPRQLVVFWTEYVLRHNGAKHLKSPAVHLNLIQQLSLDVIAFLATIVILVILIVFKCCKFICCRKSKNSGYKPVQKKKSN